MVVPVVARPEVLPDHLLEGFRALHGDLQAVAVGTLARRALHGEPAREAVPEQRTQHEGHVLIRVAREATRLPEEV